MVQRKRIIYGGTARNIFERSVDMKYDVLDCVLIGDNTSVTIAGNGKGLKNGAAIRSSEGKIFKVISVAMYSGINSESDNTTTLLVEGQFCSKTFEVI